MRKIYIIMLGFLIISCSGLRQFEKRDNHGRIKKVENYRGNTLLEEKLYLYYGNSHNPSKIIYKARVDGNLVKVREELYIFKGDNLKKLTFYSFDNGVKSTSGVMNYRYRGELISRIEYYKFVKAVNRLLITVQDRYTYKQKMLFKRRFIEYTFNPLTKQPMQVGQYVITYDNNRPIAMKTWILRNKKVISKTLTKSKIISKKIDSLEKHYLNKLKS